MEQVIRYVVEEASATVVFTASSSVHPIRSVGSVSGWFDGTISDGVFSGDADLGGHLDVPIEGLSAGNALVDREMRRRVNAGAHPTIEADIESSILLDSEHATITGTVAFLGATTLVEGEVRVVPGPRLIGTGEFDVRWWGLEPPRLLVVRVDPIVTVDIDLPLVARD